MGLYTCTWLLFVYHILQRLFGLPVCLLVQCIEVDDITLEEFQVSMLNWSLSWTNYIVVHGVSHFLVYINLEALWPTLRHDQTIVAMKSMRGFCVVDKTRFSKIFRNIVTLFYLFIVPMAKMGSNNCEWKLLVMMNHNLSHTVSIEDNKVLVIYSPLACCLTNDEITE